MFIILLIKRTSFHGEFRINYYYYYYYLSSILIQLNQKKITLASAPPAPQTDRHHQMKTVRKLKMPSYNAVHSPTPSPPPGIFSSWSSSTTEYSDDDQSSSSSWGMTVAFVVFIGCMVGAAVFMLFSSDKIDDFSKYMSGFLQRFMASFNEAVNVDLQLMEADHGNVLAGGAAGLDSPSLPKRKNKRRAAAAAAKRSNTNRDENPDDLIPYGDFASNNRNNVVIIPFNKDPNATTAATPIPRGNPNPVPYPPPPTGAYNNNNNNNNDDDDSSSSSSSSSSSDSEQD